jgi:hypothetical protein
MDDRHRLVEPFMLADEHPKSELARLHKQQYKTQRDQVYGGLSQAERAEYDRTTKRIDKLKKQLETIASSEEAQAEQGCEWNKKPETDTPQSEGRQPYRTREQDPPNAFNDSLKSDPTKQQSNPEDCE